MRPAEEVAWLAYLHRELLRFAPKAPSRPISFQPSAPRRPVPADHSEFLLLVKPEALALDLASDGAAARLRALFAAWGRTLARYQVVVHAGTLWSGEEFARRDHFSSLYQELDAVSRIGVGHLDGARRHRLRMAFPDVEPSRWWGADALLAREGAMGASQLRGAFDSRRPIKLGANLYAAKIWVEDGPVVVLNGFCPQQRADFTDPQARLVALHASSPCSWPRLRAELVGSVFPGSAPKRSLRGLFFASGVRGGPPEVAHNGVHVSPGPVEAAIQLERLFGDPAARHQAPISRWAGALGPTARLQKERLALLAVNPLVSPRARTAVSGPLFEATEDMSGSAAREWIAGLLERSALLPRPARRDDVESTWARLRPNGPSPHHGRQAPGHSPGASPPAVLPQDSSHGA